MYISLVNQHGVQLHFWGTLTMSNVCYIAAVDARGGDMSDVLHRRRQCTGRTFETYRALEGPSWDPFRI